MILNLSSTVTALQVQTKRSKILALRGKRQIGCITSAERGVLTTAAICVSATGHYVPPMLIFPRVRMTEQLKVGAPSESIFSCNQSGWMTGKDFCKWFDHFVQHTRPTPENPVLLLLDGHSSHTKNLAFVEKARATNVTVISFPPHCTHKMQPLDVSYMASLKMHFSQAVELFLKANPGKVVTVNEISSLFGKAFLASATPSTAINGFRKTGIVPFNKFIFGEEDFAASNVSDVPQIMDDEPPFHGFDDCGEKPMSFNTLIDLPSLGQTLCSGPITNQEQHISSGTTSQLIQNHMQEADQAFVTSPSELKPLPKMASRNKSRSRRKEKAAVITSSPHQNMLKTSMAMKDINEIQKQKRKSSRAASGKLNNKRKLIPLVEDSLCHKCGSNFGHSIEGENWSKCIECNTWFHLCEGANCHFC